MQDYDKTKAQLLTELAELRQRVADLEAVEVLREQQEALRLKEDFATLQKTNEELMRKEQVQAAVYRISEAAQTAQNLEELYHSIHAIIGELMPARNFYIALHDAATDLLTDSYYVDELDAPWPPYKPGKGLTAYVLRTGKPLLATPEVLERLIQSGQVELIGRQSVDWLGVPLNTQHETIGVMAVQTYDKAARLSETDKNVLVFVSTQVAMVIQRKQAEDALRTSEEQYRTLVENVPIGVYRNTPGPLGKFLKANSAFLRMFGFGSEAELDQVATADLYMYPEESKVYSDHLLAQGSVTDVELQLKKRDGTLLWGSITARVVHDKNTGAAAYFDGTVEDITERRRAEQVQAAIYRISAAAQTAQGLEELYRSIHAIVRELMPAKNFYIALYDASTDSFTIPYNVDEFNMPVPPHKRDKGLTAYVMRTGRPLLATPEVFEQLVQSGQVEALGRPAVDWLGVPLKTPHGTLGVMAIHTYTEAARLGEADKDVLVFVSTQVAMSIEHRRAEEALRLAERDKALILNSTSDLVVYHNTDMRVLWANKAASTSPDGTTQALEGCYCYEIWYQRTQPCIGCPVVLARDTGQPQQAEVSTPDGREWFIRGYPVKNTHGEVVALAEFCIDITERKQAEMQIHKLNRTLRMINEVNQTLVRAAEEAELLQRVCQIIVSVGGYRLAWVGWAERDEAKSVRPVAVAGHDEGYLDTVNISWADTERGGGPTGTAIRTGQPAIAGDILTDPLYAPWRDQALQRGHASFIALPLPSNAQAFGALQIYAARPDAFDAEEVKLLTEMADDLAYGIVALRTRAEHQRAEEEIRQLNQDLERHARELATLNQAGRIMASTLEPDTLLRLVTEQVKGLLDVEGASVLLCALAMDKADAAQDEGSELVFAAASGLGAETVVGKRLPTTAGIASWAMREKHSALVADVQSDPRFCSQMDGATGITTHSLLAVPLISKGKALGVIEAINKAAGAFDQHDLEMLEALTSSAAIALENARLYKSVVDAAERRTILHWLSQEIVAASLDPERVYTTIHQAVSKLMPAEAFVIALLDERREEIEFAYRVDRGKRYTHERIPKHRGLSGHIIATCKSLRIGDLAKEGGGLDVVFFGEPPHVRSILAAPMRLGNNIFGMLSTQSYQPYAYTAEDANLLEMLVAYGAIALENARLYATEQQRANELARALEQQRRLDQLQREFIQNVSHELRTPLALIRGHAEILEGGWWGELPPEQKESIDVIARRSQMLTVMVNDIISVLEIEQRELVREPLDLAQLVRTSLGDLRVAAEKADLILSGEIAPELPSISGDALALRRVLDNLLSNALKFTPAGGRVTVRLDGSEQALRLEVADTGIGIPGDQLGRIFERFYQVNGSVTRKYGGMGLGLALVKQIVEAHGGQITVTSEVGAGTTFTISLPLSELMSR